jgi:SAM-dependent methyltransferase
VEKILHLVNRQGVGLEVGASHNPIVPKKEGFKVHILDHACAAELREKYRGHNVNIDNIEEVDFVWRGEPLDELIGKTGAYDFIIASHVIEHTPDLISFLSQCEKLLKPSGVLSLAIPDKRYCFDYFRWPSSTGDVLQANLDRRTRHAPGVVFDHVSSAVKLGGAIAWGKESAGDLTFLHSLEEAIAALHRSKDSDDYIDVHHWRFTPSSFRLVLSDLSALGLIGLVVQCEFETIGSEFYVTLGKEKSSRPIEDRLKLVDLVVSEIAESIDLVSAGQRQLERVEMSDLRNEVACLKQSIAAIYDSRSWRITRPLRAFRRFFLG